MTSFWLVRSDPVRSWRREQEGSFEPCRTRRAVERCAFLRIWIAATAIGMAAGLAAGAALVDYGTDRKDVVLIGAVTGAAVGGLQALVLAKHRVPRAYLWALANPPAWALGWLITSYVISTNV